MQNVSLIYPDTFSFVKLSVSKQLHWAATSICLTCAHRATRTHHLTDLHTHWEVVVAQLVERRHYVWAGRV